MGADPRHLDPWRHRECYWQVWAPREKSRAIVRGLIAEASDPPVTIAHYTNFGGSNMARSADFKCKTCGHVIERVFDGSSIPPTIHATHDFRGGYQRVLCRGTLFERLYSPVAIGAGTSGGTPARV